ncbi:MAG: Flp pilus assembly complex ATPase component TadA [Lentisphaeraceae bacterium]|nr:Flp pilus assembly complex ATPase component TadA [Lentisphaeraceae bacterium]
MLSLKTDQQIADEVFAELEELIAENRKDDEQEVFPMVEWELVNNGVITEQNLLAAYSKIADIQILEDDELDGIDKYDGVTFDYLQEKALIPLSWEEGETVLALSSPYAIGEIMHQWLSHFDSDVTIKLARRSVIERKITEVYQGDLDSFGLDGGNEESLRDLAKEAPIVRLVNDVMARAAEMGASDIHVEPSEAELVIRYRVDGVLITAFNPPLSQFSAIASRLKLIGGLNIAERRVPQDGRIELNIGKTQLDVRMSTLPGMHGESIVMRLLQKNAANFTLENIGMASDMCVKYRKLIKRPHGLLLVVGPTGSGKTTTLYCVLNILNSGTEKIITVEDPVEYQVGGITQVQVKASIGLTFAAGLRSIVRQDPDIILVGEIRDKETADICINAALTGHLVLSTLHTNDAAGAVSRLQDMGVENFLIASSLVAVLSQRLVRKICASCNGESRMSFTSLDAVDDEPKACKVCGSTGYKGRLGVYELLVISETVRHAIIENKDSAEIAKLAMADGMKTIRDDGLRKVTEGKTTEEEVARVCTQNFED